MIFIFCVIFRFNINYCIFSYSYFCVAGPGKSLFHSRIARCLNLGFRAIEVFTDYRHTDIFRQYRDSTHKGKGKISTGIFPRGKQLTF